MRNIELETSFTTTAADLLGERVACRVGGIGGPIAAHRGGGAFDGTGRAPSGPGNANIADHARPRRAESGRIIRQALPGEPTARAKGEGAVAKGLAAALAQAAQGADRLGRPRGGGQRPV